MPAETHQRHDAVSADEIVDLLVAVLAPSTDAGGIGPDTPLADLGVDTELALCDLGEVILEEHGERSLGEVDPDELWSARTIGALAQLYARHVARPDDEGSPVWEEPR